MDSILSEIKVALSRCNNPEGIEGGLNLCRAKVRYLTIELKKAATLGQKNKIQNLLAVVKSYRAQMNELKIIGSGYSRTQTARDNVRWELNESAFKNRIQNAVLTNIKHMDPKNFLIDSKKLFVARMGKLVQEMGAIKVNSIFCGEFTIRKNDEMIMELKYFNTKNEPIYLDTDYGEWFSNHIIDPILKKLEEFQERDSGWALSAILNLQININKYDVLRGSSYIELPLSIKRKHACINVKNNDVKCFVWSVVAALYPVTENPHRLSKYPDPSTVLNLKGIDFPITLKQVPLFEKLNFISINIYGLSKKSKDFKIVPIYLTKSKRDKHVNLLLIQDFYIDDDDDDDVEDDKEPIKYHYVWIKDLSRLLSKQLNKHDHKNFICDRCLHYFQTEAKLNKHSEDCVNINNCKVRLPTDNEKFIEFKNYKEKVKSPFIIYADLECLLEPTNEKNKFQKHVPCSIAYYFICSYDSSLNSFKSYRGENCIGWFTHELSNLAEDMETVYLCPLPMEPLTQQEEIAFHNSTSCHICEKPFTSGKKVRDHDHFTGQYRGPAHEDCNLNFKDSHIVPIVFHNLSGYDSHFIIKDLALNLSGRVDVLPITKEKYISFTKHLDENLIDYRFIDSFRFLASGLDKLSSSLTCYPVLHTCFPNLSDSEFKLLTRKGVYPYDYFDSWCKFNDECLPDKSKFYNKLTDSFISDDDYAHAQKVWETFKMKNLGDYSDLYLKIDVLLLAEVFEEFRNSCLNTYTLDPAYSYTLPGYAWQVMLKTTNVRLELLTDIDMLMFVERGIRGGLSQCSKRYAKANNKYIKDYDPSKPTNYLLYTDINNQYGWAMSQYLPFGNFSWLSPDEVLTLNLDHLKHEDDFGYILEVDLEYPQTIHDLHSDLPFCPEHQCPPGSKQKKLLATLYHKSKYIIHYRNLQQALKYGLKLTKIHRVLKFAQKPWLKSYIDLNTKLRTAAKTDFEKNLFKLMNNAVFGKTMENIRKHSIVKLKTKWEGRYGASSLISSPYFKSRTIFNENLVAIELNKSEIYFNKPIYVGMCILDISKTKIYDFHYDYMKPKFGESVSVLYTDTDSLIYDISCDDVYNFIREDCLKYFDTSDYPLNNSYNIPLVNKKVLGLMKDENCGKPMSEFVGLRAKMYAIRVEGEDTVKKSKGVKNSIVKNRLTFNDYITCLNDSTTITVNQNLIKSSHHNVSTITQTKVALNPFDNKRYLLPSHSTLPWGHYSIMNTN